MGKSKKKGLSDKVRSKTKTESVKVNPFEVKFNKQKHNVLGRKVKHDKGKPGVSRSKAIQKRKETLLVEYKNRGKVNKFIDRRFGENDPDMSVEDKMLQRFALERQKTHERSDIFKLNEEEDLTHYGQSLSEIEKFEDPTVSDSDDERETGKIDAKLVAEEHFGGFLTKKPDGSQDGKQKSWKERMEEIIAKSKKEKYERKHEKEKQSEETEKLDMEFKDLQAVFGGSLMKGKGASADGVVKKPADDYDMTVRELQFELKGKATDRLKTEEEIAKDEAERLTKLESERQQRMLGISGAEQSRHISADDLDDGFPLDASDKKVRFEVKYKDGKMIEEDEVDVGNDGSEAEADDGGAEVDGSGSSEEGEDVEEEKEEEEDGMEATSDLESSDGDGDGDGDGDEDDDVEDTAQGGEVKLSKKADSGASRGILKAHTVIRTTTGEGDSEANVASMMENARQELPYTFDAPDSYDDFLSMMEGRTEEDQLTVLDRIRKCNHPSLAEGNKEKLQALFGLLLQYYCELAIQKVPQLAFMDKLVGTLFELTQQSPVPAGKTMQEVVRAQQQMFAEYRDRRNGKAIFPTLDTLMLLKLVSVLFPTSDFKHPVVTPATLFLSQILTQCPVTTNRDVASGLFACTLFLEYVSFSKRFVPEVINFLYGILFLCIEKETNKMEPVINPFKPVGKSINLLKLIEKQTDVPIATLNLAELFSISGRKHLDSDTFRVQCLAHTLSLLTGFAKLYAGLPSAADVFKPPADMCGRLPIDRYPSEVKELQEEFLEQNECLFEKSKSRKHLTMAKQRPQPLRQYEPQVEEAFDGKKKRGGTREFNEKQRDLHKYKKEMKGARKEIIKDMKFVHDQKLREQEERDEDRKRKVKEIYHQLSTQEGDYKALKRQKDKL